MSDPGITPPQGTPAADHPTVVVASPLAGLCAAGTTPACQVLLARQGDGEPHDPPADRGGAP